MFVHGCYWHGHRDCRLASVPKTNTDFWIAKFRDNRLRDARKESELRLRGFRVFVIWQCQVRSPRAMAQMVRRIVKAVALLE
jgi:DNA mismatch endonuclease (patch repair protein)